MTHYAHDIYNELGTRESVGTYSVIYHLKILRTSTISAQLNYQK